MVNVSACITKLLEKSVNTKRKRKIAEESQVVVYLSTFVERTKAREIESSYIIYTYV